MESEGDEAEDSGQCLTGGSVVDRNLGDPTWFEVQRLSSGSGRLDEAADC